MMNEKEKTNLSLTLIGVNMLFLLLITVNAMTFGGAIFLWVSQIGGLSGAWYIGRMMYKYDGRISKEKGD